MAQALEDCGALVSVAENAREALEILEHTEMDVLLADVAMPDEDGYALDPTGPRRQPPAASPLSQRPPSPHTLATTSGAAPWRPGSTCTSRSRSNPVN